MSERRFSRKCGNCGQRTMALATVEYRTVVAHDGRTYAVAVPNLSVPQCTNCKAIAIDGVAEKEIDTAFRRQAQLLTPEEIRKTRQARGLKQEELADLLGVGSSTVSRWETGAQIQQRSLNKMLKALIWCPQFQAFLEWLQDVEEGKAAGPPPRSNTTNTVALVVEPGVPTPPKFAKA